MRPASGVLTKEVFKDPVVCMMVVDQFPILGEMVWIKTLSEDQLTAKMSVLHCMMMSHGGELLARYRGFLQSHHEYVQSTDSRMKGYQEKFASLSSLESQVSGLQRQVAGLNDKLFSSDAAFAKSKAKGKERKKKIKSLTKSLDQLNAEVTRLSTALNQATVLEAEKDEEILCLKATPLEVQGELLSLATSARFEHGLSMHRTKDEFAVVLKKMAYFVPGAQGRLAEASPLVAQIDYAFLNKIYEYASEPLYVILQLEPEKLARPANVPASIDARVSPPIVKESTVTPASESLELPANVVPISSIIALEQNEEWVNAMVDGPDLRMTGTSHVLDDVAEVSAVGSGRVSFGHTDVVVALSVGEKGDGSLLSFAAGEEAAARGGVRDGGGEGRCWWCCKKHKFNNDNRIGVHPLTQLMRDDVNATQGMESLLPQECPSEWDDSKIGCESNVSIKLDIKWGDGGKGESDVHRCIFLSWRVLKKLWRRHLGEFQVTIG
ncbi:hypothetical protein Tco_1185164 [Tanacetum coccineum]